MARKNNLSEGCSWFKLNNLRLALGMALKFYTYLGKELKLKVRKFWRLIATFVEVTGKTLVGRGRGVFLPTTILNSVKEFFWSLLTFYKDRMVKLNKKKLFHHKIVLFLEWIYRRIYPEIKKLFLKFLQNSKKITGIRVSSLMKLQAEASATGVFL